MQCSATAKRTGRQCEQDAIRGGTVCWKHGGAAPQVRRKADERIQAMVFPALARINALIGDVERGRAGAESEAVALAAAREALGMAGYGPVQRVEVSGEMTVKSPIDVELEDLAEKMREEAREESE